MIEGVNWEALEASAPDRAALTDDLRKLALAHVLLDELGVPRKSDDGDQLSLLGRIVALRTGRFDPRKLRVPARPAEK